MGDSIHLTGKFTYPKIRLVWPSRRGLCGSAAECRDPLSIAAGWRGFRLFVDLDYVEVVRPLSFDLRAGGSRLSPFPQ